MVAKTLRLGLRQKTFYFYLGISLLKAADLPPACIFSQYHHPNSFQLCTQRLNPTTFIFST